MSGAACGRRRCGTVRGGRSEHAETLLHAGHLLAIARRYIRAPKKPAAATSLRASILPANQPKNSPDFVPLIPKARILVITDGDWALTKAPGDFALHRGASSGVTCSAGTRARKRAAPKFLARRTIVDRSRQRRLYAARGVITPPIRAPH